MKHKSSLNIESKLSEGSFGNVFDVGNVNGLPYATGYVYKEYKEYAQPDTTKLSACVDFRYDLTPNAREHLDTICCWPQELVEDRGNISGFIMSKIPSKFYWEINFSSGLKRVEAKFEQLLISGTLLNRRHIPLTQKRRYKLLRSMVRELDFLHEHKIYIGDFSHSNILFSLSDCSVFFLDCDSFSFNGQSAFPQTETGNWGVKELYPDEETGTEKSDIYKIGLLALRLLINSNKPTTYQTTKNIDQLPADIDAGIRNVIESSLKEAASRPTLAAWSFALSSAIKSCGDDVVVKEFNTTIQANTSNQNTHHAYGERANDAPSPRQTAQQNYANSSQYASQPTMQLKKQKNVLLILLFLALFVVVITYGVIKEKNTVAEYAAAEREAAEVAKKAEEEARKEAEEATEKEAAKKAEEVAKKEAAMEAERKAAEKEKLEAIAIAEKEAKEAKEEAEEAKRAAEEAKKEAAKVTKKNEEEQGKKEAAEKEATETAAAEAAVAEREAAETAASERKQRIENQVKTWTNGGIFTNITYTDDGTRVVFSFHSPYRDGTLVDSKTGKEYNYFEEWQEWEAEVGNEWAQKTADYIGTSVTIKMFNADGLFFAEGKSN